MIQARKSRYTLSQHGAVPIIGGKGGDISVVIHMQTMLPLQKRVGREFNWSWQHEHLSSRWQIAQYDRYRTPAVWRATESQEEAFHRIESKGKAAASMELQGYIFPKKKQTGGMISVFRSNT